MKQQTSKVEVERRESSRLADFRRRVQDLHRSACSDRPESAFVEDLRWAEAYLIECDHETRVANAPVLVILRWILGRRDASAASPEVKETDRGLEGLENLWRSTPRTAGGRIALPPNPHLTSYVEEVLRLTQSIDIQGIASLPGAGREAMYFAIDELYTPLKTVTGDAVRAGNRRVEARPLTALLSGDSHVLLVGDPGGGKTTFLRLVACILARDWLAERTGAATPARGRLLGLPLDRPAPLPVFLRLPALSRSMTDGGDDERDSPPHRTLLHLLGEQFGGEVARLVEEHLDIGGTLLLLDGLDEISAARPRERIVQLIDSVLKLWGRANRVVVTTRPFGFEPVAALRGVQTASVEDFDEAEIRDFLRRWVHGLDAKDALARRGTAYLPALEQAIVGDPNIRRLARNPVMLTCLCVVHWNERRLPEGKVDLLAAVLRWLLASRDEKRRRRGWTTPFAEECFKDVAFRMTFSPAGKQTVAGVDYAASALGQAFACERGVADSHRVLEEGRRFLEEEALDSGIVVQPSRDDLRFWHLTFQEHYAARALADLSDDDLWGVIAAHVFDRQWAEIVDHLAGCLVQTGRRRRVPTFIGRILELADPADLKATVGAMAVLGRILRVLAVYDFRNPFEERWVAIRDRAQEIFTEGGARRVSLAERIAAADALGQAGDSRLGVEPETLPIPGVRGVSLGRYPVAVSQFEAFVNDGGYEDGHAWGDGWVSRLRERWTAPQDWATQTERHNHPVVGLSWHEALAYCNWMSARTNREYRLPTATEWQAAATHPAGPHPWGEGPDPARANYADSRLRSTTPVGLYPAGAGPGGHLDLAGNVWEWCADLSKEPGYARWWQSERKLETPPALHYLKGGSWSDNATYLSARIQRRCPSGDRSPTIGFRVAVSE